MFALNIMVALVLGALIGAERQWRQRFAGMQTNALVAAGSALFVTLSAMTVDEASPTRIAAQVVSGIGFLGAGVIMKEGLNVTGLNTAATLWCSAAVGTLAGSSFLPEALGAAMMVLGANLVLIPLARRIDRQPTGGTEREATYHIRATCRITDENQIRSLIIHTIHTETSLAIRSLRSKSLEHPGTTEVVASIIAMGQGAPALERVVSRLSLESGVSATSWELADRD